jgi:hypothetical protein
MSISSEIVETEPHHVAELVRTMRQADRQEQIGLGLSPERALSLSLRYSLWTRAALIGGEVAAIWGLGGEIMEPRGTPWLLTAAPIERLPITFLKVSRQVVAEMLAHKPHLSNHVADDYNAAVRYLKILGFRMDEPQPMGPEGKMYRRFWMEA